MKSLPILAISFSLLVATGAHGQLTQSESAIAERVEQQFRETVDDLAASVDIDSATENLAGVKHLADFYARQFEEIGFETKWIPLPASTGRAGRSESCPRPACQ